MTFAISVKLASSVILFKRKKREMFANGIIFTVYTLSFVANQHIWKQSEELKGTTESWFTGVSRPRR